MISSDHRREVSIRVILDLIERCKRRGIDRAVLLEGVPERPELHQRSGRVSWAEFARILDNLLEALGASWELERLASETVESNRTLQQSDTNSRAALIAKLWPTA